MSDGSRRDDDIVQRLSRIETSVREEGSGGADASQDDLPDPFGGRRSLLVVRCGRWRLGLPHHWVRGVRRVDSVLPLPRAPSWLRGVAMEGGEAVPLVELALLLDEPFGSAPWIVFVETRGVMAGLLVRAVEGTLRGGAREPSLNGLPWCDGRVRSENGDEILVLSLPGLLRDANVPWQEVVDAGTGSP